MEEERDYGYTLLESESDSESLNKADLHVQHGIALKSFFIPILKVMHQTFNEGPQLRIQFIRLSGSHEWHASWTMQKRRRTRIPHQLQPLLTPRLMELKLKLLILYRIIVHATQAVVAIDRAAGRGTLLLNASVEDRYNAGAAQTVVSMEETDRRSCLSSCSGSGDEDEDQRDDALDRMESLDLKHSHRPGSIVEPEYVLVNLLLLLRHHANVSARSGTDRRPLGGSTSIQDTRELHPR
jgi:hypothetical protein